MSQLSSTNFRRAAGRQLRSIVVLAILMLVGTQRASAQGAVVCPPNIDFSYGLLTNWQCYTGTATQFIPPAPLPPLPAPIFTGITPTIPITGRHTITSGAGLDQYGFFPEVAPGGGLYSLRVGDNNTGSQAERVRYYVHVPVGFNNYSFNFRYAVVFEQAGHTPDSQPAMIISAYDSATNVPIPCATLTYVAANGLPGFFTSTVSPFPQVLPWTSGTLNLSGQGGKTIIVEITTYDCTQSGHFGYGYFDIISCGQFAAAVTFCDLNKGFVTLGAPAGYATYRWYRGPVITGAPISTAQNFNLSPVPTTPTFYYCVITPFNSNGCPDTIRTRVISDFRMNATPDTVCNTAGRPLQLCVTATGGLDTFNYSWMPNPSLLPTPNPLSGILHPLTNPGCVTAQPTGAGFYVVTVTDTGGCYRSDTVVVQNPTFTIIQPDTTTCLHTPIRLNPRLSPPGPGYVFAWRPRANLNDSTLLRPLYTPVATGTEQLILRVDSGVCALLDTINVTTLPDTFSVRNAAVCERQAFNADVTSDPTYQDRFTYHWSPTTYLGLGAGNNRNPLITPDTSITYAVTMRFPGCPDVTRNLSVRVEPNPRVDIGNDTIAKCFYTPLYLTANVLPTWFSNYTYSWQLNTDLDNTVTPLVRFTGQKDTTLYIEVKTPLGCRGTDSIRVNVYDGNFASVTPSDTAVCPRSSVSMTASGGVSYQWVPGTYLNDSAASSVVSTPITTTDYILYATDDNGCIDTLDVHLQVYSEAIVSLPDSAVLFPGDSHQMDPGGNALYFNWFPTVGLSNPGIGNPVANPDKNTRYFVTGTTEAGCVSTDSIYVMVHQSSALNMPNAFSPGPGPNGRFKVARAGIASLKSFRVYNRWGTKIYESKDIDEGWNGTFNGEAQPMGVYIYTVEALDNEGHQFVKNGNVTLIR